MVRAAPEALIVPLPVALGISGARFSGPAPRAALLPMEIRPAVGVVPPA